MSKEISVLLDGLQSLVYFGEEADVDGEQFACRLTYASTQGE